MNLKKIESQLNSEVGRQMGILFPATAIALVKMHGWGPLKIEHFFDETSKIFDECGAGGTEVSIIQMLDERVGISLKADPNGKEWRELCFLNHNIPLGSPNKTQFTEAQFYAMRVQQIKWLAPAILAAEFIALHDKYHFSRPMLADLMAEIDATRKRYRQNEKRLSKALYELTGINTKGGKYDRDRIPKSGSSD